MGTLIYFMLKGEMPFGSWRESELTFARIAKGQFTLPETFSHDAVDLISKVLCRLYPFSSKKSLSTNISSFKKIVIQLLEVDENSRLGSQGVASIKSHPWFSGFDWNGVTNGTMPAPQEMISRIKQYLVNHGNIDNASLPYSPPRDLKDLNTPEWLEHW